LRGLSERCWTECERSGDGRLTTRLLLDQLKDTYYAEKKILKALPKMAKGAQSAKLSAAFRKHLVETEGSYAGDWVTRLIRRRGEPAF
jgi:hypothetical protein